MRKKTVLFSLILLIGALSYHLTLKNQTKDAIETTTKNINEYQVIDEYLGVEVYYNSDTNDSLHYSLDGYLYGKRWQCVEFVKRFYYQVFNHKMNNQLGNAIDFYDSSLNHGEYNQSRGMYQYQNYNHDLPKVNDLIIFNKTSTNPFGHVGIVAYIGESYIEIISQNTGYNSRIKIPFVKMNGQYHIDYPYMEILGWLSLNNY